MKGRRLGLTKGACFLASKGLRFLACVECAKVRMAGPAGSAALAAIGKDEEHKEERSLERLDMEVSRKRD